MKEFVHLHNHTEYSLLDGCTRLEELAKKAADEGARAVAITDHGNMYGAIKFYKACQKYNVKPLLGCEFYVADDLNYKERGAKRYHLILLAKNLNGFHNLMTLSSIGFVDGFYERPRIDYKVLAEHSEDLICLSGCIAGALSQILLDENRVDPYEDAVQYALETKAMFAEGDYYIELQNHGLKEERRVLPLLKKIAKEIGVKCVATNDLHYLRKSDAKAHDVLLCIGTAKDYDDPNRFRFPNNEFYYKTYDEMLEVMDGDEEVLANTLEIADKIDIKIKFKEYCIPYYEPPKGMGYKDDADYLRKMAFEGLKMRYGEITPEIQQRAEYELNTIITMGFASYYLIVWDFINYAKSKGIPVGAGRGSGVGSIVAYAIRITEVDPLRYDLIFERFLNSSRMTMPDFDVDFCSDRREEVIDYVREKYGYDHVTQIITFGKMKKKNAIKNVARVFKVPFAESNALVKNITDNDKKVHIKNLIDPNDPHAVPELIAMLDNPLYKEIFDIAIQIEDLPRDRGKHAAGVIICPVPVSQKVPLSRNGDDITTQFDMVECEELGLLKMDFLALKTLTDVKMATDFVKKYEGKEVDFDKLGYEDREVYDMIGSGETDTVFQLESGGMKNFMKQLRPTLLEEIIAGVSLYRPGPMDYIPRYVNNKMHQDKIDYRNPKLEPILKNTYGIVVYQEQAMRITQALAGYTLNEADNFRKLISKKKTDQLPIEKKKFVGGCVANGIDETFATTLWGELEAFGNYAFNKSHAAAYAVLTYQTAFLKHYYPIEYLCAVMNNRITNPDDTTKYLKLIKDMGIELLPPDVNESEGLFLPEGRGIRYGLVCIKNVGRAAVDGMVKERKENGKFKDFSDFVRRVPSDALNKRLLESLIKGGAFDCFGKTRNTLMANYEEILNRETKAKNLLDGGQMFFDFMIEDEYQYKEVKDNRRTKLADEKDVLGRYLSGHPLDGYEEEFKQFDFNTTMLTPIEDETAVPEEGEEEVPLTYAVENGARVHFGGLLSGVTMKVSKTGKRWGFATLEDFYGSTEVVFYSRVLQESKQYIVDDALVRVTGKIVINDNAPPKIELLSVRPWDLAEKEEVIIDDRTLCVRIENDVNLYNAVMELLQKRQGSGAKVVIQVETRRPDGSVEKKGYRMPFTVKDADDVKANLVGIVGYNNVKII
ncbi:MAG: DNA polymerase III subunit alpha [Clostridia bacterium]|nr:DNA polymerase III subunit alpha [Clostridia bacterium]